MPDTPDFKKVLDNPDKNEAAKELQKQMDSQSGFSSAKDLLKDADTRSRMKTFINDPAVNLPEPIRTNLNRIIGELEHVGDARTDFRTGMENPPAEPPSAPPTAPPAAPIPPAAPAATTSSGQGQPASGTDTAAKTGEKKLSDMSFSDVVKGLGENLFGLISAVGSFIGGFQKAAGSAETAAAAPAANKFTSEQIKAIRLDLEKNKETQYENQDKCAEYVCDLLGLPRVNTVKDLLDYLQNTEIEGQKLVFNRDAANIRNLKAGDVVFFRKDVNQAAPHLTAAASRVVTEAGQPEPRVYVKTVPASGGQPAEMELAGEMRTQYFGAVQIPQNQPAVAPKAASPTPPSSQ